MKIIINYVDLQIRKLEKKLYRVGCTCSHTFIPDLKTCSDVVRCRSVCRTMEFHSLL